MLYKGREGEPMSSNLSKTGNSEELWEEIISTGATQILSAAYRGLLGREADPGGLKSYVETLKASKDLARVLCSIVSSREFARNYYTQVSNKPCLVFLHIQKTAGTSIQNHLVECFKRGELYKEHTDSLSRHSPLELLRYEAFAGHFNYDSLKHIPRTKLSIFTFVRDPKNRLVSLYHFWRAHQPWHKSFHPGMEIANTKMMEEFFEDERIRKNPSVWNHMAQMIMGQRLYREWRTALTSRKGFEASRHLMEETIRPAIIRRLKEFLFVGIQEDFTSSVRMLFSILEKKPPPMVRKDHTLDLLMNSDCNFKKQMDRQPLTPRVDAALDGLVELDNIVYEESVSLYREKTAESEAGTSMGEFTEAR